jgi:PAS domain S-box-containing protein
VKKKFKILLLKCAAENSRRTCTILRQAWPDCEIKTVSDRAAYLEALAQYAADAVVAVDSCPALNAFKALIVMKESGHSIPFLVVAGGRPSAAVTDAVKLMKHGAQDYILQKNISTLPQAINNAIDRHKADRVTNTDLSRYMNTIDEVFFTRDMRSQEVVQVSGGSEAVYGYSTEEFFANPGLYAGIYHPEDQHILLGFVERLKQGEQVTGKYRIIHKDGGIRWIESKIIPTLDEEGMLLRIDGVSRNITRAKEAADQLKLSEQRYRQMVETAEEGIWIIDVNLATTFVNKRICEMLGYTCDEIIGKHNYDFKDNNGKAKTLERIKNRPLGATEVHESTFITKNGKQVFCRVATNGMYDNEGKFLGTLAMLTDITQQKADEDTLRRSEANLSAVIENTTDLVYSIDSSFRFITFNQLFKNTMKQVYGFDVEQGISVLDLLEDHNRELAAKWRCHYQRSLDGETHQFVNEYPVGEGKVYLNYSLNPIREGGRVIGLSCFSRDITQQKLTEIATKKSAANFEAIIENTDASIYSIDAELRYVTFNKLYRDNIFSAFNIKIKPGDYILDCFGENGADEANEWQEIYNRALKGKKVEFVKEFQFGRAPLFISFSVNPIWENGVVIGLSCSTRDKTRERMDEIAIRKSEASLRTIFNNTDMACMLLDDQGQIVLYNNLARTFFKDNSNQHIREGLQIASLVEKERRQHVHDVLIKAKSGPAVNYQLNRHINGVSKWFELTWAGINDQRDQDFGYIFTMRDITEKKKLELEREKITSDLLQRNKALEQFTYIISHNLRAPLANIIGLSDLLTQLDIEDGELNEIVNGIGKSANKLDEVILDLNQVLQINEDINENIEVISLPQLIEDIKFSIRNLIEKENVNIVCNFEDADDLPSVKSFIHSIFYNLVLNSIKYRSPGRPPVIRIGTKLVNEKLVIRFSDNGRGIDTNRHAGELFGLYKRFDTSVEGKGMGLFMVKMQVESLGGHISVISKLNQGTEFQLEFPMGQLQSA